MTPDILNRKLMYEAWSITAKALNDGVITKPRRCTKCKRVTPSKRLNGHHVNYARPLDIVWLCDDCHKGTHKAIRWMERAFAWLIHCKEKGMNPDEVLLPHIHKRTGIACQTTNFEYWNTHGRK